MSEVKRALIKLSGEEMPRPEQEACLPLSDEADRAVLQSRVYALVRPIVGCFEYDDDARSTLLADIEALAGVPGLKGVMVACEEKGGMVDLELATRIVEAANGLEVWYHRGSVLLKEGFENALREAGFHGVVHGLLGDTVEVMVDGAVESLTRLEAVGLRAMLCGSVPSSHVGYVGKRMECFVERRVLRGWCVTVAEDDGWYGALMPWRHWEVSSSVWPGSLSPVARGSGPESVKRMIEALPAAVCGGSRSTSAE